ncbi:hypothetical protein [Pirellulimonas nuda]|uniref:hypothetical protein n=1 Tax=Pirellulimonas nuda TaxID=2528009 RepID=UPI0011A69DC3|nr:hypothetical protein [Pirellulimonas nuda]
MNDAPLAQAIERLRGEWRAASGGELDVFVAQDLTQAAAGSDVVVFASRYLGELCCARLLRPIRAGVLESEDLALHDVAPLARQHEIRYGGVTMALPLGCPTPLLAYAGEAPPDMWGPQDGVASPLEGPQAAYALLVRAACYASHPSREAMLFDPDSMAPRLTEQPFVRALEELASVAGQKKDPAAGASRVAWPDRTSKPGGIGREGEVSLLPGAGAVYNAISDAWEATESPRRVTLLASSGRLAGVTAASRNAASAFRLVEWLAGRENARQLATASPGVAASRTSLRRLSDPWLGPDGPSGSAFSSELNDALAQPGYVTTPRIIGVDRYLEALAAAVRSAARDGAPPAQALQDAAAAWEALTEEAGRDLQRRAYRADLGQPLLLPKQD